MTSQQRAWLVFNGSTGLFLFAFALANYGWKPVVVVLSAVLWIRSAIRMEKP